MNMKKQIVVTCSQCRDVLAFSKAMTQKEAEGKRSGLAMNPFGAPRCKKCKGLEPYSDINLMHKIEVENYNKNLALS